MPPKKAVKKIRIKARLRRTSASESSVMSAARPSRKRLLQTVRGKVLKSSVMILHVASFQGLPSGKNMAKQKVGGPGRGAGHLSLSQMVGFGGAFRGGRGGGGWGGCNNVLLSSFVCVSKTLQHCYVATYSSSNFQDALDSLQHFSINFQDALATS